MNSIKLSISSIAAGNCTPEKAIRLLSEAGYRYMELGSGHGEKLQDRSPEEWKVFRQYAEDRGIRILQGHLPLHNDITEKEEALRKANVAVHRVWLRMYHVLGIRAAVLHCGGYQAIRDGESVEEVRKRRLRSLRELLEDLPKGLILCLENLPTETFEEVEANLRELDWPEQLGFCLDTGHRHFSEQRSQADYIRRAGKRLHALHLHDNVGPLFQGRAIDCRWWSSDKHIFPGYFSGSICWQEVVDTLREIGYSDLWNLEVEADFNNRIPGEAYRELLLRQDREKAELIFQFDPDAPDKGDPVNDLSRIEKIESAGVRLVPEKYQFRLTTDRYEVRTDPVHGGKIVRMNASGRNLLLPDRQYGWGAGGLWLPKTGAGLFQSGMLLEKAEKTVDGISLVFSRTITEELPTLSGIRYEMRHHYTGDSIQQTVVLRNDTDRETEKFAFRFFAFPAFFGGEGISPASVRFSDGARWERDGRPVLFYIGKPEKELELPMEGSRTGTLASPEITVILPDGSKFRVDYPGKPPKALAFWDSDSGRSTLEPVWSQRTLLPGETAEFSFRIRF